MKKSSEPFPSGKYNNCEVSRRLYRGAVDAARRLDDHLRNSLQQDIFGPDVTSLRMRLKDYCERLLFSDPLEYGRKAEELMWRKVYYDFFQFYKQQKKKFRIAQPDSDLQSSLLAGIGNYHHLILRLQAEFQLNLENKIDVPFVWQQRGIKKERWKKHRRSLEIEDSSKTWAEQMCHRFLICLGDLSRYLCDAGDPESSVLSKRYYYQAFFLSPTSGMPLNQLGTLSGTKNYGCEALYFYMRCLLSQQPFDGVEGNLSLLFEKNNENFKEIDTSDEISKDFDLSRRFASRFLKLCEHFYYQKDENLQGLCQDVLKDFDLCLQNLLNKSTDIVPAAIDDEDGRKIVLTEEIFFKIIIVSLVCFARLQQQGSSVVSAAAAFTLSLLSHVVRHCLKSLSQKLLIGSAEIELATPIINCEDEICNSGTSGTVTPRTAVQTPIHEAERLKEICQNQYNNANVNNMEDKKPKKKKIKKKKTRRTIAEHLRKARRRRNCSSTSQEDSEDVSEGEVEKKPPSANDHQDEDDEILEGTSDDEVGDMNSDISETGSVYSSSDDSESEEEEPELEEEIKAKEEDVGKSQENVMTNHNGNIHEIEEENDPKIPTGDKIDNQKKIVSQSSSDSDINNETESKRMDVKEILENPEEVYDSVASETLLASIKVLSDWLKTNTEIVSACAESSKPLWSRLVDLLNLLIKSESKLLLVKESESSCLKPLKRELLPNQKVSLWTQNHFLLEDLELQQLLPLVKAHNQIQQNKKEDIKLSSFEQVYLRVQCLIHFGFVLADCFNTGIKYDYDLGFFEFLPLSRSSATNPNTPTRVNGLNKNFRHKNGKINGNANYSPGSPICGDIENDRKQLMRNMAHLWLKSEVKDLEKETRRGASASNLSPYLVPDTTALCHHLIALKQLESAKRFILILPSVVVSNLDLLKKDSLGAREAIRWIETEMRRGSRFLRAQKQHERLSLLPMKYPRKKDKDAWDFFQILECCNYLSQQSASGGGCDPAVPMVTLVTGASAQNFLPTNASAIAKSSGVSMESVDEFISKWRSSSKSQG